MRRRHDDGGTCPHSEDESKAQDEPAAARCTEQAELVCLGRRFDKGKMTIAFAEIGRDPDKPTHWPVNRRTRGYTAGGVYTVKVSADRTHAVFSDRAYQDFNGQYEDTNRAAAWRIADEAAIGAQRLYNGSRKAGEAQKVLDCLAPLRTLHRGADRTNRRLIELTVLEYLRGT